MSSKASSGGETNEAVRVVQFIVVRHRWYYFIFSFFSLPSPWNLCCVIQNSELSSHLFFLSIVPHFLLIDLYLFLNVFFLISSLLIWFYLIFISYIMLILLIVFYPFIDLFIFFNFISIFYFIYLLYSILVLILLLALLLSFS